jgi:hypothetical protein
VLIVATVAATILITAGRDEPTAAASSPSPAAVAPSSTSPTAVTADVTCREFQAAAVSGTPVEGMQPIEWTTQILETRLAADGKPTPARVAATSEFFSQVIIACFNPDQSARAVAETVYAAAPSSFV